MSTVQDLSEDEINTINSYNANAHAFASSRSDQTAWAKEKNTLISLSGKGSVIDIGSGGGRDTQFFISKGYTYVGIDYSDGLLQEARLANPGATFLKQSVYNLKFPPKTFDLFWACAILLHIPKHKINVALQSIRRILKPHAVGCITLKKGEGERVVQGDHKGLNYSRFFSFYEQDEFAEVLHKNEFTIKESYITDHSNKKWLVYFVTL